MQLFISYARADTVRAESLTLQLRQAGINVWLDSDLVGGQAWWERILDQLRSCDAVIAVVSAAAIASHACRAEREYGAMLGRPVLPVIFESINSRMLPADIAGIRAIDYRQPSEATAFELIGAILALPQDVALPDPLPAPPPMPTSAFGPLVDRLAEHSLSMNDQLEIIQRLEAALGPAAAPHDRPIALDLLGQMEERPDLFAAAARQIERIRAELLTANKQRGPASRTRQWSPPPPRPSNINGSAIISISRQLGEMQYKLNAWLVFIDGQRVGKIWQGQRCDYPVPPGTHEVQIKVSALSSFSSPVEALTLNAGDRAGFSCGLGHPLTIGNALTAGAWKDRFMAPKDSVIRLSRE
jgi:TIR domain